MNQQGDVAFNIYSDYHLIQSGSNICNLFSNSPTITLENQQAYLLSTGVYLKDIPQRLHVVGPDIILHLGYHVVTSTFNKGFTGQIKAYVLNTNVLPITIHPGELIGQLLLIKA